MSDLTPEQIAANLHKQADARKTDPSLGEGVIVSRGDEGRPAGKRNTFADRQAMFAKSDRMRAEGRARSGDDVVDTSGATGDPVDQAEADRILHLKKPAQEGVSAPATIASPTPSNAGQEYVSLQLQDGGAITVARSDIEAAGGAEGYLRRRRDDELDLRARTAEREAETLRAQLAESNRLREELARSAGQGGPAGSVVDPTTQRRNDAGSTGVDEAARREKAKALARDIYSGDAADAERAIDQILAGQQNNHLSIDEVVRQATERLRAEATQTTAKQPVKTNPVVDAINEQINDMSRREFADVVANPEARAAAYQRFLVEVRKPENKDRRALDVARDSMASIRTLFSTQGHPRADVIESKRGLPSAAVASGATAPAEAETEDSRSYIERLQSSRNFGRRHQ